jgi:GcrA cell cycle regulator
MIWDSETESRLRVLWAEGHSASEIGRRLGVSKDAVIGKSHRLGLSGRPSPIKRTPPAHYTDILRRHGVEV